MAHIPSQFLRRWGNPLPRIQSASCRWGCPPASCPVPSLQMSSWDIQEGMGLFSLLHRTKKLASLGLGNKHGTIQPCLAGVGMRTLYSEFLLQ